jgi:ATP-dependent Clp protease ATP-binding subunit ClpC
MKRISTGVKYAWILASGEAYYAGYQEIEPVHFFLGILKLIDIQQNLPAYFDQISEAEIREIQQEAAEPARVLRQFFPDLTAFRRNMRQSLIIGPPLENVKEMHRSPSSRRMFEDLEDVNALSDVINITVILIRAMTGDPGRIDQALQAQKVETARVFDALFPLAYQKETVHEENSMISNFGRNLNRLAREGKLSEVIGREKEIIELGRILIQKKKGNAIILGDAGVGKTAVVEGLAVAIVQGNVPPQLKQKTIFELNMASVVAGTKFRGEFEERLQAIINEVTQNPHLILFMDEVHTLLGAGATGGAMDASNILKPALARGDIHFIGATTWDEYRRYIEKDPALLRRMQTVNIEEPTKSDCLHILDKLKKGFQEYYGVVITDEAIQQAIELSIIYLPDLRLPDKAIDILESACSSKLFPSRFFSGKEVNTVQTKQIGADDIRKVVARKSGVPIDNLRQNQSNQIIHIDKFLKERIIGQDEAIRSIAEVIKVAKAGFKEAHKPIGVFLFCGPTGVGKTETAKLLAEFFSGEASKLVRFDMSEYMEKHEISKLLGAPPGYIGHEEEGQLIRKMRTNPGSVVLFDEIEKAHPDINNIFLQIFDEGVITGSQGKKAYFNEAIIILTSNLGTNTPPRKEKPAMGFKHEELRDASASLWQESVILQAVKKHFSPEIINRIQSIVVFNSLDEPSIHKIIEHHIGKINRNLEPRKIVLELTSDALALITRKAYSPEYGARNITRTVDTMILVPLSKKILEENLSNQSIVVDVTDSGLKFREKVRQ